MKALKKHYFTLFELLTVIGCLGTVLLVVGLVIGIIGYLCSK